MFDRLGSWEAGYACAAAVSAAGAVLAQAAEAALQLFGVPLPVLLAALTGALGARVFLPAAPFWRALAVTAFWTLAGAFTAQLALWGLSRWLGTDPPAGALAGVALLAAAAGQRVMPILWERGGAALERRLDRLWADKGGKGDE